MQKSQLNGSLRDKRALCRWPLTSCWSLTPVGSRLRGGSMIIYHPSPRHKKSIILAFLFLFFLIKISIRERERKEKEKCCGLSARSRDDFMEAAQRRHLLIKTYESSLPGCLLQAPSPTLSHLLFLIFFSLSFSFSLLWPFVSPLFSSFTPLCGFHEFYGPR